MSTPNFDCWGVVIDTDAYAGNFERQMCAHCTGYTGDCGVGRRHMWETNLFGDDCIASVADEHGCHRPCSIYPSPNGQMNSVVIYFYDKPIEEHVQAIKDRSMTFFETDSSMLKPEYRPDVLPKVLGWRLVQWRIVEEVQEI